MGTVKVTIGVGDPQGRQFEDVEVVVDTGSTYTAVPRELLQRLGVPVERSLPSETADGRILPVDVGETTIRLEGLQFHTPVIFAEAGEPSLLGVSAWSRLPWPSTPWQDGSYPPTCSASDQGTGSPAPQWAQVRLQVSTGRPDPIAVVDVYSRQR